MPETIEIKVEGMGCEGCSAAVTRAISGIDPGAAVRVDLSGGLVTVAGASVPAAALATAIIAAGYEVPGPV